jgi:hypothetical protein
MARKPYFRTVSPMKRNRYLDRLRSLPALQRCTRSQLEQVARLVDDVDVPAGTQLVSESGELIVTLAPTRALVVDRRSRPRVLEVAPALGTPASGVPLQEA